jgi:hypothetical protein
MPRGRVGVFMGYADTTDKQLKFYAPDLGYVQRTNVLELREKIKGGTIDLRLRNNPNGPQGTPNTLLERKPRGRPKGENRQETDPCCTNITSKPAIAPSNTVPVVEIPYKPLQENIPAFDDDGNRIEKVADPNIEQAIPTAEGFPMTEKEQCQDMPTSSTQHIETSLDTNMANTTSPVPTSQEPRYYFRDRSKQKRELYDQGEDEGHQAKRIKAMLAMLNTSEQNDELHAFTAREFPIQTNQFNEKKMHGTMCTLLKAALLGDDQSLAIAFPAAEVNGIKIPQTYKDAIKDPKYGKLWKEAIDEEIHSLIMNGTWEECLQPNGTNLVSTKWVFSVKTKIDGSIERFKARLVARGFSQAYGVDYTETFAPTVRMDTFRIFMAMIAKYDLETAQFDIKNAFTEAELKEHIYLTPPKGLQLKKDHVLRALRSLYGLKQAGRNWNKLLHEFLTSLGFTQSLADPCLYTHFQRRMSLLLYVDDIIAAAKTTKQLDWLHNALLSRFNTKYLGEIGKILGIRVTRDRKLKTLYLDQEQYLSTVCDKFGITNGKYKAKKIPVTDYNSLRPVEEKDELIDAIEYASGIGNLMYGMIFTRPDLAFALGRLSQYMAKPAIHHGHALKNLMRYVRSTIKQKIRFGPGGVHENKFGIYTDADWASDKSDRKSISGGIGMFYGGPYCWASRKQKSVATSSAESEYVSQSMYAKQGQWTAQVFRDLGMKECIGKDNIVTMYGDNQGAIALTKNPHLHERSKHIDICYHFIRDLVEKEKLKIIYIPTEDMIADGLTKPLQRIAFTRFKQQMGIVDEENGFALRGSVENRSRTKSCDARN